MIIDSGNSGTPAQESASRFDLLVIPEPMSEGEQAFSVHVEPPSVIDSTELIVASIGTDGNGGALVQGIPYRLTHGERVTISRPAAGEADGSVRFRATFPDGSREIIQRTIPARRTPEAASFARLVAGLDELQVPTEADGRTLEIDERLDQLVAHFKRQDDVRALLLALGLSDHSRPRSPHQVLCDEVLPAIAAPEVARE